MSPRACNRRRWHVSQSQSHVVHRGITEQSWPALTRSNIRPLPGLHLRAFCLITVTPCLARVIGVLAFLSCLNVSVPALAQAPTVSAQQASQGATVRTTRERTLIWSRSPSRVIATLPEGVVLDAVARDAQWIEVRVPEKYAGAGGAVGWVYEGHVEILGDTPLPATAARAATSADRPDADAATRPRVGFRGYGDVAYQWFTASDSFKAIFDTNAGVFYGGGGQVTFGNFYVDVNVQRFEKTGERAFVFEGDVFRLGIPDRITMTPLVVTAGYRFVTRERVVPYVGGGVGSLRFEETADFGDPDDDVSERFTSYHAVAGAEYAIRKWLFVAGEVRYAAVPDALGAPGISADFDESDLGGVAIAVKVMVGR